MHSNSDLLQFKVLRRGAWSDGKRVRLPKPRIRQFNMKIILSSIIPFKGYLCINLYGTLYWRKEYANKLNDESYKKGVINHEAIHTAQMEDFCKWKPIGGTIFYIIYFFEWLFRVLFVHPFSHEAYRSISFEREAYAHEKDLDYLATRGRFAQWKS